MELFELYLLRREGVRDFTCKVLFFYYFSSGAGFEIWPIRTRGALYTTHTHTLEFRKVYQILYAYTQIYGDTFTSVRTTGTFRTRTETKTVISAAQYTDR